MTSDLGVAPVKDPTIEIVARGDGSDGAVLELAGVLSHRDPSALLAPFFQALHQQMVAQQRRKIRVDLRKLRFMNSASFKHFVGWIKANGGLPDGQRYAVHFVLNPAHHWQEVSIHALSCFSAEAMTVEKLA